MSPFPKILIILALWLLYTFLLFRGCSDQLCLGCGEAAVTGAAVPADTVEAAPQRYPIDFKWSDPTAFTNEGYAALRQSVLDSMSEDRTLEITGLYFEGEPAPEGYANMGFARADRVRQLFAGDIPEDQITLKARLIDSPAGIRDRYFEGVLFDWVEPEEAVAETLEELDDRVNIRFPYNSVQEEYSQEVESYLRRLVDRLQNSDLRIQLIGHADNSGDPEYNYNLGLRRARAIERQLIEFGAPAEKIEVDSKGETQPIANNQTPEGRHENRRVEVRLLNE